MFPHHRGKPPWLIISNILHLKIWKLTILLAVAVLTIYCAVFLFTAYPPSGNPNEGSLPIELVYSRRPPSKMPPARNPRLIGVDRQNIPHYKSSFRTRTFRCIGSKEELPVERVNDDYCDCSDGSDEPATSACSYTVKQMYFFCTTTVPGTRRKVPSAWVGDGICDCCDGSDEWARSDVRCMDRCGKGLG
ncbi:glucosidase 2 subunit beta-like [Paramacrobiotus metropolitanus]|uniref:glucosidase 2 subunit beta-like n=1 Tax=Paramacrobiotus metropolitanus TaxID=2943436 RepID=UPI00244568FB|nr:glucosidase 2 subunit beta-like [Paramacrobiotus metropolitanus]